MIPVIDEVENGLKSKKSCSGPNVIKLFTSIVMNAHNKRLLVSDGPFHPRRTLMFVGKARSFPYGKEHVRCFVHVGPGLSRQNLTCQGQT